MAKLLTVQYFRTIWKSYDRLRPHSAERPLEEWAAATITLDPCTVGKPFKGGTTLPEELRMEGGGREPHPAGDIDKMLRVRDGDGAHAAHICTQSAQQLRLLRGRVVRHRNAAAAAAPGRHQRQAHPCAACAPMHISDFIKLCYKLHNYKVCIWYVVMPADQAERWCTF